MQKLFILLSFLAISFAQNATSAPVACANGLSCTACSAAGCSYCMAYSTNAKGGCYPGTATAASLNCNGQGYDYPDVFIAPNNAPVCFGGCGTGSEDCNTCTHLTSCGWCFSNTGGNYGCFAQAAGGGPPPSCTASWTVGSCVVPCTGRVNCQSCLGPGNTCGWVASSKTSGYCVNSGGASGNFTVFTNSTMCPALPPAGTGINLQIMGWLVVVALLAIAWI